MTSSRIILIHASPASWHAWHAHVTKLAKINTKQNNNKNNNLEEGIKTIYS